MRRASFQAVSPVDLVIEVVTSEPDRLLIVARPTALDVQPVPSAAGDLRGFIVGVVDGLWTCLRTAVPFICASGFRRFSVRHHCLPQADLR